MSHCKVEISPQNIAKHNAAINRGSCYMTVKRLKEKLADVPDDYIVCYQRIGDSYFDGQNGWFENAWLAPGTDYLYEGCVYDGDQYLSVFNAYAYEQDRLFLLEAHY